MVYFYEGGRKLEKNWSLELKIFGCKFAFNFVTNNYKIRKKNFSFFTKIFASLSICGEQVIYFLVRYSI